MPSLWIVHRVASGRAALARLAMAGEETVLGAPSDPLFDEMPAPDVVLLGLSDDLEASFNFLVSLRLRGQVSSIEAGKEPSNYIGLDQISHMEQARLRLAFEAVRSFQEYLELHFQLDFVRRIKRLSYRGREKWTSVPWPP